MSNAYPCSICGDRDYYWELGPNNDVCPHCRTSEDAESPSKRVEKLDESLVGKREMKFGDTPGDDYFAPINSCPMKVEFSESDKPFDFSRVGIKTGKAMAKDHDDQLFDVLTGNKDIESPSHYTWLPNGIEVWDILELLPTYNISAAAKYLLRCGRKGTDEDAIKDLKKAKAHIEREIKRRLSID